MLQLNTVILNLAIARYLELPTAFATLNLLTKHEDMNQDPSELVLSLHHSISYLFVLIHHYDKSEKKKKICYLVHLLYSLSFRSFKVRIMLLLKLSTKLHDHHHLHQPSILSGLYHRRKEHKGEMWFISHENQCLPLRIYSCIYL